MPDGATTPSTAENAAALRGASEGKRWPLAARLVLILGGAALLWGGIFALIRALL